MLISLVTSLLRDERGIFGIDDLIIGGLIAGAGSAAGSAIAGSSAAAAQHEANETNIQLSGENRAFQENMANTAHQREVADLEKAGFNRMLSVRSSGAATPNVNTPTVEPVNPASGVGDALKSMSGTALQIMQTKKDFEQKDAQIAAQKAGALASVAQANNAQASARATEAEMPVIRARASSADAEYGARKATAEFDKKAATYDGVVNRVLQGLGGISDAVSIRRLMQGTKNDRRNQIMREETHMNRQGIRGSVLP